MSEKKAYNTGGIRIVPFVTILIFLIVGSIGIMTGEVGRVLEQAVQVCLSCIGIG